MKKRASAKNRGARKSGRSKSSLAGNRGPWITRGLVLRGILVYVLVNLAINVWLSTIQPFSAWRLLTFRHLPARMEAVWYYSNHMFPIHACEITTAEHSPLIRAAAREHGLDPAVFRALVEQESRFDPHAISHVGAMGLTQLMPGTAAWLKVKDPFDPAQNLDGGARYLKQLLRDFRGNTSLALAGYNAGPGAVRRFKGIPPYGETRHYVSRILARADVWRGGPIKSSKSSSGPAKKVQPPSPKIPAKSPPPPAVPAKTNSSAPPPSSSPDQGVSPAPVRTNSAPTPAPAVEAGKMGTNPEQTAPRSEDQDAG